MYKLVVFMQSCTYNDVKIIITYSIFKRAYTMHRYLYKEKEKNYERQNLWRIAKSRAKLHAPDRNPSGSRIAPWPW